MRNSPAASATWRGFAEPQQPRTLLVSGSWRTRELEDTHVEYTCRIGNLEEQAKEDAKNAEAFHGDLKTKVALLEKSNAELQTALDLSSSRHLEYTRSISNLEEQAKEDARNAETLHGDIKMKDALMEKNKH